MLKGRPSHKELTNKIRQAKEALQSQVEPLIKDAEKIAIDALELGYLFEDEIDEILNSILDEIRPEHYVGQRPPKKSYEPEFESQHEALLEVEKMVPTESKKKDGSALAYACPNGHGPMNSVEQVKKVHFRGVDLDVATKGFKCMVCGIEASTIKQTGDIQSRISSAYRMCKGLLTSAEIREGRKNLGISQQDLARKMNIGVASLKRWEKGAIQTPAMDKLLRNALQCEVSINDRLTGNRELAIPRVKLVLREFERQLGRELLVDGDLLLFSAKYLFYADMVSYHNLGKSMTGATYARLPHGPQLNNYKELIPEIRTADENEAEPLTEAEIAIIRNLAQKFPNQWDAFNASHKEAMVLNRSMGALIYYTDANDLTEVKDCFSFR